MGWFKFLKAEGYFDPEKNPEPIQVDNGFQIPFWGSLNYLEKVSQQIKEGKNLQLIDEVIAIIKNVSENPKDNYRTWYMFIKIICNLPNNRISNDILNYIPTWLSGNFDTTLQSSEICLKLLPKFLYEGAAVLDIEKADLIITHLFKLEKQRVNYNDIWIEEGKKHYSRVQLHYLSSIFIKERLSSKVAKFCSDNVILNLGRAIKKLILDYPNGINSIIKVNEKEFEIKTIIENENLVIFTREKNLKGTDKNTILHNFEKLEESQLKEKIIKIINEHGIKYEPLDNPDDTFHRIKFALNNDLNSSFGSNSISKLGDMHYNEDDIVEVYSLIFRDLLNDKTIHSLDEAIRILRLIIYDKMYRIPFFIRIALYVIAENWEALRILFYELCKDNDSLKLFSEYKYEKDVYKLLNKNQKKLDANEIELIQSIINRGSQNENESQDKGYNSYWKLRWYSALRDIGPFKDKYNALSKEQSISHEHFENLGEVRFRNGSVSPFTEDQILNKGNIDIIKFTKSFKPKDRFEEPTIGGLANAIGKVSESNPQKFVNEIELFTDTNYIYIYHLLNGLKDAWKNKRQFDWNKVLSFCKEYITNPKFYSGELYLENDNWGANSEWVVGSIANLITEGLQNDENAFELVELPITKKILIILVDNLCKVDDSNKSFRDYPTYSLNSTAGKVLRALLDYSLRRARNNFTENNTNKWESDIKKLFEDTFIKEIIDGHILIGMYFPQFYYLDKEWIIDQVKLHYNIDNREWHAFMGGLAFGHAVNGKDLYQIFHPHYERAFIENEFIDSRENHGIIHHLVSFYFWDYVDLKRESLLTLFINKAKPKNISEFANFVWRQKDYMKSLDTGKRRKFEKKILKLWEYLSVKYDEPIGEEEENVQATLCNFLVFFQELNEKITDLIIKSSKSIHKRFFTYKLIENLVSLKEAGNPSEVANNIGQVLLSLQFEDYLSDQDTTNISGLVIFLYQNGQNETANLFCNKLSSQQHEFLKDIYMKFN